MAIRTRQAPFAKRSLGQNFLIDDRIVEKMIEAVRPVPGDLIVEIGPGRGALTEKLVASGATVTAIELDSKLACALREKFAADENFLLIEGDVLKVDLAGAVSASMTAGSAQRTAKLVANLPYNISTAILQSLAERPETFATCILMFQREVAERITAAAGSSKRGFLTVLVEAAFKAERLFEVPPSAFRPVPKVWSTVLRLEPKPIDGSDRTVFRDLVSAGFLHKRKTLLNNLKARWPNAAVKLENAGIDPRRRAESLTLVEWERLAALFDDRRSPSH